MLISGWFWCVDKRLYPKQFTNKCVDTVNQCFWVQGREALRPSRLHVKASVRDATTFAQSSWECTVQHFVGTCLKMVDKRVRLYSLFQNYTSFIWVTPPSPFSHSPQSFCNVIDSILRKCIYFQIKYLFKETTLCMSMTPIHRQLRCTAHS